MPGSVRLKYLKALYMEGVSEQAGPQRAVREVEIAAVDIFGSATSSRTEKLTCSSGLNVLYVASVVMYVGRWKEEIAKILECWTRV